MNAAPTSRWPARVGVLVAAFASIATSRPMMARDYPMWEAPEEATRTVGCASLRAWVSKSGKEGVGVSVELFAPSVECNVGVSAATLRAGERRHQGVLSEPLVLAPGDARQVYIAFPFDNEKSWNDGVRAGDLDLTITAGATVDQWTMPLVHRFEGFHKAERRLPGPSPGPAGSAKVLDVAGP